MTYVESLERELLTLTKEYHKYIKQLAKLELDITLKIFDNAELKTAHMEYTAYQEAKEFHVKRMIMVDRRLRDAKRLSRRSVSGTTSNSQSSN